MNDEWINNDVCVCVWYMMDIYDEWLWMINMNDMMK